MRAWIFGGALLFAIACFGCTEADELLDCNDICERYQDCEETSFNVGACRDRCEDDADKAEAFKTVVDECEKCLGDRACDGAFEACPMCAGIVP